MQCARALHKNLDDLPCLARERFSATNEVINELKDLFVARRVKLLPVLLHIRSRVTVFVKIPWTEFAFETRCHDTYYRQGWNRVFSSGCNELGIKIFGKDQEFFW